MTRLIEADRVTYTFATPAQIDAAQKYIEAQRREWAVWLAKPDCELEAWQVRVKRNRAKRLGVAGE